VRAKTIRTTSLVRAAIITSLVGHWVANALFDADQYAGAGDRILGLLDLPILVQALLGLIALALLSWRDRRAREGSSLAGWGRARLAVLLVGLVCVLFVGMESSERLTIEVLAGEQADVRVFGEGFVAELLVAVGSALMLAILGATTKRILGPLRPRRVAASSSRGSLLGPGFRPALRVLSGAGGVRAPPS
jgi:hypothetical protein